MTMPAVSVFCSLSSNPVVADLQYALLKTGILRPEKRTMAILSNVSSVIQPGRMTLLLGPPAAGKSTLLKALAGKLARERGLKVRLVHAFTLPWLMVACKFLSWADRTIALPICALTGNRAGAA